MRVIVESLFAHTTPNDFVLREDEEGLAVKDTPHTEAANREDIDELSKALAVLPLREKDVVIRRFGLEGEGETFTQIGKSYNVSKQRVSQWQAKALKLLRENVNNCNGKHKYEA